jgi:hypothetical protein
MHMETTINRLFEAVRAVRQAASNFVPVVFWMNKDGEVAMVLAANEDGSSDLSGAVRAASEMLREAEGKPEWMAVAVDAYGRIVDRNIEDTPSQAGLLDLRFQSGDEKVVEQLMLFLADPAKETVVYRQVYRYTPVDGWEWDDIEHMVDPILPDKVLMQQIRDSVTAAQAE